MDPNRNADECCEIQTDDCKKVYNDYHGFITRYFENDFMINGNKKYEQGFKKK